MGTLNLRSANADDIPAILQFWTVSAENDDRPVDSAEAVGLLIDRDPEALTLAYEGHDLVGTIISGWDGWRCHLYRLAVDPDHRRRGVGRVLLDHAEQRLEALGASRIDAMVLTANGLGQSIWEAHGYERQERWRRWVKPLIRRTE